MQIKAQDSGTVMTTSAETSSAKPIVLVFASYYLPGFRAGGPVISLANLVATLGDEVNFRIVTRDRDLGSATAYQNQLVQEWQPVGKASVHYLAPSQSNLRTIRRLMSETAPDSVYLNSVFDVRMTLLPLIAGRRFRRNVRFVLAPRGEFAPGALALKAWKKRIYLKILQITGMLDDLHWQASSSREAEDIRRALPGIARDIEIAPDLPSPLDIAGQRPLEISDRLRMVLVGRVSRMKNIDFAIRVAIAATFPVTLTVVGPIEDQAYYEHCLQLAKQAPPHVSVNFVGARSHQEVPGILAENDLFFLPTLGENYGHAIIEAMQCGLPVLISDRTSWHGLEEAGAGGALQLEDEAAFIRWIEAFATSTGTQRANMVDAARNYARQILGDNIAVAANRNLFPSTSFHSPVSVRTASRSISASS